MKQLSLAASAVAAALVACGSPGGNDGGSGGGSGGSGGSAGTRWTIQGTTYSASATCNDNAAGGFFLMQALTTTPSNSAVGVYLPRPPAAGAHTGIIEPNKLDAGLAVVNVGYKDSAMATQNRYSKGGTVTVTLNGTRPTATFTDLPVFEALPDGGTGVQDMLTGTVICP